MKERVSAVHVSLWKLMSSATNVGGKMALKLAGTGKAEL